jgi:hypothetical protein
MVAIVALSGRAAAQTPPLVDIVGSGEGGNSHATVNNDAGQVAGAHNGIPFVWDSTHGLIDLGAQPEIFSEIGGCLRCNCALPMTAVGRNTRAVDRNAPAIDWEHACKRPGRACTRPEYACS